MQKPQVPPLKRPSVISAQSAPRPAPFRAPVTASIPHPGPALRALVADDQHGAGLDGAAEYGLSAASSPARNPGHALEAELIGGQPGHLHHAPRGERTCAAR